MSHDGDRSLPREVLSTSHHLTSRIYPRRTAPCLRAGSRVSSRHSRGAARIESTGGMSMSDQSTHEPSRDPVRLSRRKFVRVAGITGAITLGPAVLRRRADAQETPSPVRPDPAAKRGGTLKYGVLGAPAHFDVHQSGTVSNIGPQSPMYDLLIRRDPRDGQTVIPDLAWKWDITPDGKKYTFYLRKGVKFHDGADLTAEDVRATYQRIVSPPKGVVIPLSSLFTTVNEITVLDPLRIEFRLSEPRPQAFMMGAFASGWYVIVRQKHLADNSQYLREHI